MGLGELAPGSTHICNTLSKGYSQCSADELVFFADGRDAEVEDDGEGDDT